MAKYSDYFSMQDFLPVYDITAELQPNSWKSFIPTQQFETLLQHSLTAITSADPSKRVSIWVRGTFGTGKSHASSVIKHLLCDDKSNIEDYAQSIMDVQLRNQLLNFRSGKKLFPVVIKGVEGAYDIPRFKLSIQRETKNALRTAGYSGLTVKSDYEIAIEYIKEHDLIVKDTIAKDIQLRVIGKTPEDLIKKLQTDDSEAYMQFETSLNNHQSVYLQQNSISDWLQSIETEIEKKHIADGLIIFWDEFTSVLDTIKSGQINVLQNIAEKSKHCNLFLFLISHRVENSTDLAKMNDRFDIVEYKMTEVSAYLIMRHTYAFKTPDASELQYNKYNSSDAFDTLLTYLSPGGAEEKKSISDLYPLHPYTAYLCSRMADHIGSANRSVVKFMHDEKAGFAAFIDQDDSLEKKRLLTADWLWDFFTPSFEANENCSLFVSTFNSHRVKCAQKSEACERVFKAVLLLNALSVNFDDETKAERLTPNENNLIYMFIGDLDAEVVKESLAFLDEKNIVSKNVLNEFKIAISSYSPAEIQQQKTQVSLTYQTADKFLKYNNEERQNLIDRMNAPSYKKNNKGVLYRPCELQIYSCEDNEAQLQSMLRKYDAQKPNFIHIAYFLALTPESRDAMNSHLPELSKIAPRVIMVLPEAELTAKVQSQFIDAIATLQLAKTRFNEPLAADNEKQAKTHIKNWMAKMAGSSYKAYLDGECYSDGILININKLINQTLAFKLFPHGFEQVPAYRSGATANTFFKTGGADAIVKKIVEALDRDNLINFSSSNVPAKEVFELNGNILVDAECRLTPSAKSTDAWLVNVCQKVDECMENAREQYSDKFVLSDVLAPFLRPPYGFFQTPACFVAISYALRKYREDLFIPRTAQPITAHELEEMIVEVFRLWNTGEVGTSNKLYLRFGSPEESKLTDLLKGIFTLRKVPGVKETDIKCLAMAKWAIQEYCKVSAKRPLWAAKYSKAISSYKPLLEELIEILDQDTAQLEKVKKIVPKLEHNKEDLLDILSDTHSYEEGFDVFLDSIKGISIEPEWRDDLMKEIAFGLPPEIAFWKEPEVQIQVMQYYIAKTHPQQPKTEPTSPIPSDKTTENYPQQPKIEPTSPIPSDEPTETYSQQPKIEPTSPIPSDEPTDTPHQQTTQVEPADPPRPGIENPDAKRQAKNKIRNMDLTNVQWQMMMLELLNSHPEIAEYINHNWD